MIKRVNELTGIKESDTGLAPPALWDLAADKQTLQNEQPLQVFYDLIYCSLFIFSYVNIVFLLRLPDAQKSLTPILMTQNT